jgi:hypothetical protein
MVADREKCSQHDSGIFPAAPASISTVRAPLPSETRNGLSTMEDTLRCRDSPFGRERHRIGRLQSTYGNRKKKLASLIEFSFSETLQQCPGPLL